MTGERELKSQGKKDDDEGREGLVDENEFRN